jgi:hypothetical protein
VETSSTWWDDYLANQRHRQDEVGRFAVFTHVYDVEIGPDLSGAQASTAICDAIPAGADGAMWVWADLVNGWAIACQEWRRTADVLPSTVRG